MNVECTRPMLYLLVLLALAAEALEASSSELWLSPITTWECLLLATKGGARLEPDPEVWIRKRLEELRPIEAPVNHEVVIESERIDLAHQDPADRFLAATAVVFDLTLVTADDRLLKSKSFAVMPNK